MKTKLPLLAAATAAVAVAAAAAAANITPAALANAPVAHAAATHVVKLQHVAIHPSRLAIRAGDRVTWKFLDGPTTEHTVTSVKRAGGRSFKGTGAHFNGAYSVTFGQKGTYYYFCQIHPGMQGSIVVR